MVIILIFFYFHYLHALFVYLCNSYDNQQKFECQYKSYKHKTELTNFCQVNKVHAMFWFNMPVKVLFFKIFFSICYFVQNRNKQSLVFVTFILDLNLEFSSQHSKFEQKHEPSFVYLTKNCELCVSLMIRRLTLRVQLTARIALYKAL